MNRAKPSRRLLLLPLLLLLALLAAASAGPDPDATTATGTISGRVTFDDGRPAVGDTVQARSTTYNSPAPAAEAVTDADGRYTLHVPTAPPVLLGGPPDTAFTVRVQAGDQFYQLPDGRTVTLTGRSPRSARNVDFRLTVGPLITVRVHDITGRPVPGLPISQNPVYPPRPNDTVGVTDAQGIARVRVHALNFSLRVIVPPDEASTVQPSPDTPFDKWFQLTPGQGMTWDLQTYRDDGTPADQRTLHGVVLGPDGRPAPFVAVDIDRQGTTAKVETDAAGRFSVPAPNLTLWELTGKQIYVRATRGNQAVYLTPDFAQGWGGMTLRLKPDYLATVTGTVVGTDGRPLPAVPVGISYGNSPHCVSDKDGHFQLSSLWPGYRYQLACGGQAGDGRDFGTTLYPAGAPFVFPSSWFTLRPGETRDVGRIVVPLADGHVAGQVVDPAGRPVPDRLLFILLRGKHIYQNVSPDADGRFHFDYVVHEPLTLTVYFPKAGTISATGAGYDTQPGSRDVAAKRALSGTEDDVRLVITPRPDLVPPPTATVAAPAPPPPPVASTEPPTVVPMPSQPFIPFMSEETWINGLLASLTTTSPAGTDPARVAWDVTLSMEQRTVWRGALTDMDGMAYTLRDGQGTLKDRQGRAVWQGTITGLPTYVFERTDPPLDKIDWAHFQPRGEIRDARGRLLWSGLVGANSPPARLRDGTLEVFGPGGKVIWRTAAPVGATLDDRENFGGRVQDFLAGPPAWNAVLRFSTAPRRVVFRDAAGHVLYDGRLPLLSVRVVSPRDTTPDPAGFPAPSLILPYEVAHAHGNVQYTVYDAQGKPAQQFPAPTSP